MAAGTNISAEDRHAATNVTTSQAGHRFEIQLGHLCNNRCVFCSSGQLTAMKIARPVPLEPIVEALAQARRAGATHLTFLGGEPTIHKRFLEAVQKAVELGFEHIVIFTNGVMFPHPGFIDSVTALGRFEWRISIQGATEEAHVATTGRAQSFQRILHGLAELQRQGQTVTTNMCVNERSYRSLPHYPELIARYGVGQLHVDIVRPESTGERDPAYLRDIMPRYSDMAPYYAEMLAGFERWDPDFDINVGNLPYCILPEWASRIHHGGQQTVTKSSDGAGLEDEMNKYEWQASLRTHLPTCDPCVFRSRCTGIFRVYLELHGGEEFRGLSYGELAALDPEWRNFVMLVEPYLAPLRQSLAAGEAPAAWRFEQEICEDRRRCVEMVFGHGGGGRVRLRFARQRARPLVRTDLYDVELEGEGGCRLAEIRALADWVVAKLAAGLSPGAAITVSEEVLAAGLQPALLARGRQRVEVLGQRLLRDFALPGWRLEPLRWASERHAELVAVGRDGLRVELRFRVGTQGTRSQVGVDLRPSGDGDRREAEDVARELAGLLRDTASPGTDRRAGASQ